MSMKFRTIDEVEGFCGWEFLLRLVTVFESPMHQGFIASLFETGGRISEVLQLRKTHFNLGLHPELIVVEHMPVLKRYELVEKKPDQTKKRGFHWVTKKKSDYRFFPIRRDEALVPYMLKWLEMAPTDLLFQFSRVNAFLKLRRAGEILNKPIPFTKHRSKDRPLKSSEIFPHLLRAERASQLASEYGFDVYGLRQFFGWKPRKLDMAEKYASLDWKGLARRMGVNV
jgi:integrase